MRTAISYIRWSSLEQSLGDSQRRQIDRTQAFCRDNSLVLDYRFVDSGLSSYTGENLRPDSALSRFLKEVEDKKIPAGAVLVVESLDRLWRQKIPIALELFLRIIRSGIDIVTLIDGQWYSQESLGEVQNLLSSIVAMWRAYEDSRHKAERCGAAWENKRDLACRSNLPMSSRCPGWLRIAEDGHSYEKIAGRAKIVKLIYWLTIRRWGKRRIVKLFNKHRLPTWGVGKRAAQGWHYSYVDKILHSRSVLGEFVPHTTRPAVNGENGISKRRPIAEPIPNYYPRIVSDDVFEKVQQTRNGPCGPVGPRVSNIFQGLLKDGENPKFTMCYKDHGSSWKYVVSDHRRLHPEEKIFSWCYDPLEKTLLDYLRNLDWLELTSSMDSEVRELSLQLARVETSLAELNSQIQNMVLLVKSAGHIAETTVELNRLESQRAPLRTLASGLRDTIAAKRVFSAEDGSELVKRFGSDRRDIKARLRLRSDIRHFISRIDLFRNFPLFLLKDTQLPNVIPGMELNKMLTGRCIRIVFANGAERWLNATC